MKTNAKIKWIGSIGLAIASLYFVSCKKDSNTSPEGTNTQYNMYMTDAPNPQFQQVNVNIISAEVNTDAGGWVALNIQPAIYDLLTLANGKTTLLASGNVRVGHASQVRLTLGSSGNTVMVNGILYPLQTPSGDQSGLKLNVDANLAAGTVYNITLDFDAGMSVVTTGNGSYILKPVIRALLPPYTGGVKGTIIPTGTISAIAVVSAGWDTVSSYSLSATGTFLVNGLASGTYKILVMPMPPYAVQNFTSVAVTSGQVTDIGTINLQ